MTAQRPLDRIRSMQFRLRILPPSTFTVKGVTYRMDGADLERFVVFFFDPEGKRYEIDYDTLVGKIMADMELTGRKDQ